MDSILLSKDNLIIAGFVLLTFLFVLFIFFYFIQKNIKLTFDSLSTQLRDEKDKLNNFIFELQKKNQVEQFEIQTEMKESIFQNFLGFSETLTSNLRSGAKNHSEAIQEVVGRLARIDEAQKKLDSLSDNVTNLSHILNDKKTRGIFGESQLSQILFQIFGESQTCYSLQHKMPNNTIVDCLLYLPEPMGKLAVDSKFPLENFKRLQKAKEEKKDLKEFKTNFQKDIKKHLDDISKKYIIEGFTSNQAMMFIPAETIYLEIQSHHQELVDYAHKKRVWIASPTTMMSILSTVQVVIKGQRQSENIKVIQEDLRLLSKDFKLWRDRWEKLGRSLESVQKSCHDINVSSDKIDKRFQKVIDCEADEVAISQLNI